MKKLFFIVSCLINLSFVAQYRVEWLNQTGSLVSNKVNNILSFGKGVLVSEFEGGIKYYSGTSDPIFKVTFNKDWVLALAIQNNKLLSIGKTFNEFDFSGVLISSDTVYYNAPWGTAPLGSDVKIKVVKDAFYCMFNYTYLAKYDLEGKLLWQVEIEKYAANLKFAVTNSYIYLYSAINGNYISKYDSAGNLLWRKQAGFYVDNILSDEQGNYYILAVNSSPDGSNLVAKFNGNGELIWENRHQSITSTNGILHGDSLILCGGGYDEGLKKSALRILSNSTGISYLEQFFDINPDNSSGESLTEIAITDNVFYCGGECKEHTHFLVKISDPLLTAFSKRIKVQKTPGVFPNPSPSFFTVRSGERGAAGTSWTVINSIGEVIMQGNHSGFGHDFSIDLSAQPKGVYFLELLNKESRSVHKLIRN